MPYFYPKFYNYKNYTGNGITPRGGVTIDDNGIATGFSYNAGHLVLSTLTTEVLKKPYTLQFKVKNNDPSHTPMTVLSTSAMPIAVMLNVLTAYNSKNQPLFWYSTYTSTTNYVNVTYQGDKDITDPSRWYYYIIQYTGSTADENFIFKVRDEDYNFYTDAKVKTAWITPRYSGYLSIGNHPTYNDSSYSRSYSIDLSETFIRDENGKIISPWNI